MRIQDPELPAYVTLDEVVEVSGLDRETLRRHLKRRGVLRRIGNRHSNVDTSVLATAEPQLHLRLLQRRVQQALEIDDSSGGRQTEQEMYGRDAKGEGRAQARDRDR